MKISFNWLKDYLNFHLSIAETSKILTDIGLEVEGEETFETVKGSLAGVVIGEVKSVLPHPNADRLQLCKINVGHHELLDIVCGATNIAEGQKVVVALVGCTLYPDSKGFTIQKSKIRGAISEGMICAEDELGLGRSHEGIMVLDKSAKVGMPAGEYFEIQSDTVFEIGLTPNRIDAASHYGVARDLAAYLSQTEKVGIQFPQLTNLDGEKAIGSIKVVIEDESACPRYAGITLNNLKVGPSPQWLQNRLKAIGQKPINNVVDVTNYVMQELGQPLHAFDTNKIKGDKVIVKTAKENQPFVTLDEVERKLSAADLMIFNAEQPMCIAGVFGGLNSGVTDKTTSIFLESAYFHPTNVRKTAKRHGLNTDASFRFERGVDPNMTILALQRAAYLLKEVAGGNVSGRLFDHYPNPIEDFLVDLNFDKCTRLIGKDIPKRQIKTILESLEISILNEAKDGLRLKVPAYRVDVQREVDVIEEILRIYGYNNIELPEQLRMAMIPKPAKDKVVIENIIANYLSNNGFAEILNNSLSNPKFYPEAEEELVKMLNPLSKETEVLRKSMLFGGLDAMAYNVNRKRRNLKLFEFGKTYRKLESSYEETQRLGLWICGDIKAESWQENLQPTDFFELKSFVINVLDRLGLTSYKESVSVSNSIFVSQMDFLLGRKSLVTFGELSLESLKQFDLKETVFYAEFNWSLVLEILNVKAVAYQVVTKFPAIRRDLALLVNKEVEFQQIKDLANKTEKKLLKSMNLFDVYEGKNLGEGKKSYGVSFHFQDEEKTLTDKQIDKVMDRLIANLKGELAAELR